MAKKHDIYFGSADSEHLSLVSIQALRRVLIDDDDKEESEPAEADTGGFNPYPSG